MNELQAQRKLKRMAIAFAAISVVILLCGLYASFLLTDIFQSTQKEQAQNQIQEYQNGLIRKVHSDQQPLYTLAGFLKYDEELASEGFIQSLYQACNQTSFMRMAYFNQSRTGVRVASNNTIETKYSQSQLPSAAQQAVDEAWQGQGSISAIYYDEELRETVVAYAVPVWTEDEITGVLVATKSLSTFAEVLNSGSALGDNGVVALVDSAGNVITGSQRVTDTGLASVYNWESIDGAEKKELVAALQNLKKATLSLTIYDYDCYALVEPAQIRDWSLVLIHTQTGFTDPLYQNVLITRLTTGIPLVLAIACIFYGYRQMRKINRDLLKLAYYDGLTGAYNQEKFNRLLELILEEKKPCCVAALNIRHFKFINELFGVEQANRLLCHIKILMDRMCQSGEFFCRQGADCFYLLLAETERDPVFQRIALLMEQISNTAIYHQKQYPVLLYCGVAFCTEYRDESEIRTELMRRVLLALGQAKRSGVHNICFYDQALHRREQLQNYIESHMKQALHDHEFQMYLQPKINLKTGKLGGAEALVRWATGDGEMIFPDQFIPLFEENGFCVQLDLYMVEQACCQLRNWMDQGRKPIPISVNQSKLLFYEPDYVQRLCHIISNYDIPANLITLEILEGLALNSLEELNQKIAQLRHKGFRISMDDFDSGYSSLNTLGNIQIDELKLDRGFLMAAAKESGGRQRLIMEQIILLAQKMDISTVAEGVETARDEEMIQELGCDFGQGYYYSRPISVKEFGERYMK